MRGILGQVWRLDKAADRRGLQQLRRVDYSNTLHLPEPRQLMPGPVKFGLPVTRAELRGSERVWRTAAGLQVAFRYQGC